MDKTTTWLVRAACAAVFIAVLWQAALAGVVQMIRLSQQVSQCQQALQAKGQAK